MKKRAARAVSKPKQRQPKKNPQSKRLQRKVGNSRPPKQEAVAAAYATTQYGTKPRITRASDGRSVRIVHRELVASIIGTTAFGMISAFPNGIALNPGLSASFPWLATQAVGWERYRFNRCTVASYTRTGTNVPGSLMIAPDYDASDSFPTSEQNMSAYQDCVEDAPWKDIFCHLNAKDMDAIGPSRYIRNGAVSGTDIKTYDVANVFVATVDGTAVNWGKLWIEYDVTLMTPQLPPGGSVAINNSFHATGTTQTTANAFPNQAIAAGSNAGLVTLPATGEIVTFNVPGEYLVVYNASSSATSASAPTTTGTFVTTYGLSQNSTAYYNAGNATGALTLSLIVSVVKGNTLTFANTVTGGSAWELFIAQLPSAQA